MIGTWWTGYVKSVLLLAMFLYSFRSQGKASQHGEGTVIVDSRSLFDASSDTQTEHRCHCLDCYPRLSGSHHVSASILWGL